MSGVIAVWPRLLDPTSTAAVILGAHDWADAGLGRAAAFLRSAKGIVASLYSSTGLGLALEAATAVVAHPVEEVADQHLALRHVRLGLCHPSFQHVKRSAVPIIREYAGIIRPDLERVNLSRVRGVLIAHLPDHKGVLDRSSQGLSYNVGWKGIRRLHLACCNDSWAWCGSCGANRREHPYLSAASA
jgi:hypothetical protein